MALSLISITSLERMSFIMIKKLGVLAGLGGLILVMVGCGDGASGPITPTMDGPRDPNMKPMAAGKTGGSPAPIAEVIENP